MRVTMLAGTLVSKKQCLSIRIYSYMYNYRHLIYVFNSLNSLPGVGAGFYVDATEPKWSTGYNMYSYVTKELPELIKANFNVLPNKESLFGFSMGGHGALITALKNPGRYSVSEETE